MKILGTTDENTTCDKCGKTNLKGTVALETGEGIVHYGTTCAAKAVAPKSYRGIADTLNGYAKAVAYARKWITVYGAHQSIADQIAVHWTSAVIRDGAIVINVWFDNTHSEIIIRTSN